MATVPTPLRDPLLVAVWPGMGSVALLAGSYLAQQLSARRVAELDARHFFQLQSVEVKNGLASMADLPRSMFLEWRDPNQRHDLLIFIGEAQPERGGYTLCQQLLDYAVSRGVTRFFTFAAMATQLHPSVAPRTFAVATDPAALADLKKLDVTLLKTGQISGLNGILLGAGAERGLSGMCLLGELPFFAVAVPNPAAAKVVLERFSEFAGIELDLIELSEQAKAVESQLTALLEQLQAASGESEEPEEEEPPQAAAPAEPTKLDPRTARRIEQLFQQAKQDHGKVFELKRELDRLKLFKQYEDRFLDLFKAE